MSYAATIGDVARAAASYQGYVDERTVDHVAGWVRDLRAPHQRVTVEILVVLPGSTRSIATVTADHFSPTLRELGVGDARYKFELRFPAPLSPEERDHLIVRPLQSRTPLELAPQLQGYVDERSIHHVAGWLRNRSDPSERVAFEVVLPSPDNEQILASGRATEFSPVLAQLSMGDATYGFRVLFPVPLTEAERDRVIVRAAGTSDPLELAPALSTVFEPISHVAMDIVNNCNLRCPFCVFDYSSTRTTRVMTPATFDAALQLIPYVTDGNFWLSCLHEATMHPELMAFIERVPPQWRRKIMYTTNLARPMPDSYFTALAASGLHHINISLESLDPAIYERMRKGARWRIFSANWDKLIPAMRLGPAPPRLRYNMMAYRSNLAEIPELVAYLRNERLAWQVEIRHTFDVEHIPDDFRESEFLRKQDWAWLKDQLAAYKEDEVLLIPPPDAPGDVAGGSGAGTEKSAEEKRLRVIVRPLNIRMEWDGKLMVYGETPGADGVPVHEQFLQTNIHHLRDPRQFLTAL
jgi:MoaA/NifB/PqqE/SkfB family radical SAM enzyme